MCVLKPISYSDIEAITIRSDLTKLKSSGAKFTADDFFTVAENIEESIAELE